MNAKQQKEDERVKKLERAFPEELLIAEITYEKESEYIEQSPFVSNTQPRPQSEVSAGIGYDGNLHVGDEQLINQDKKIVLKSKKQTFYTSVALELSSITEDSNCNQKDDEQPTGSRIDNYFKHKKRQH